MNIYDIGGITTFIAVVATIIGGAVIFILLHKMFDIVHFGLGAVITFFFFCCVAAAFIVNLLGGLVGGIFSVLWFLVRMGILIAVIASLGKYIYSKVKGMGKK